MDYYNKFESDSLGIYRDLSWQRNAKDYYKKLMKTVIYEYTYSGSCILVNFVMEKKIPINSFVYAGLMDAYNTMLGRSTKFDCSVTLRVHSREKEKNKVYEWDKVQDIIDNNLVGFYDYDELLDFYTKLNECGRRIYSGKLNGVNNTSKFDSNSKIVTAGKTDTCKQIVFGDEPNDTTGQDDKAITNTNNTISSDDKKPFETEEKKDIVTPEIIKEFLDKQRQEYQCDLNEYREETRLSAESTLGRINKLHDCMCEESNKVQVEWVQSLDKTINELNGIKADFYSHIRNWQVSLYESELEPLATCYVQLYEIVNTDKLIAEAISSVNSDFRNIRNSDEENISGNPDIVSSPVIKELTKLDKRLQYILRSFESALGGLDLFVFFPEEGDSYDEIEHTIEDDTNFDRSKEYEVVKCIAPGIKKRGSDSKDDVILSAVVSIREV